MTGKAALIQALQDSYTQARAVFEAADPDRVIYEESGWRVKDIAAHVATWEAETLRSLHAFRRGGEYQIANYENADDFNAFVAHVRMDEPMAQILADWDATRKWIIMLVRAMSDDDLAATMRYPAGDTGRVDQLVREVSSHPLEHAADVRAAIDMPP